jgi:hypothetical protein
LGRRYEGKKLYLSQMDEEILKAHTRGVRNRFAFLKLTAAQAERIVYFEEEQRIGQAGHMMSVWEESEYRLDTFQKILNEVQFGLFEKSEKETMRKHEKEMRVSDAGQAKMVAYEESYIDWLKKEYIPTLRRESLTAGIGFFIEIVKVDYIRAEHRAYLRRQYDKMLIRHYRYSGRLQPNKLCLALLWWERLKLLPNYDFFLKESDDGIRHVGAFLLQRYAAFCPRAAELLRSKKEEIEQKGRELRTLYLGEPEIRGWHTTIMPRSKADEEQAALMMLMMMD